MNTLSNLIIDELGQKAADALPDIYQQGWRLPLTDDQLAQFDEMVDLTKFSALHALALRIADSPSGNVEPPHTLLASRIPRHDFPNLYQIIRGNIEINRDSKKDGYKGRDGKDLKPDCHYALNDAAAGSVMYKSLCLSMAFLASGGDEKFLSDIPPDQVHKVIDVHHISFYSVIWENVPPLIKSTELCSVFQLFKNAVQHAHGYGKEMLIQPKDGYLSLAFVDQGRGILDKAGKPLPSERLHEVFQGKTTKKRGGLGLQVVKALTHLRGGYLEVITTTKGNPTISYNTRDDAPQVVSPKPVGTTFVLYLPQP